MRALVPCALFLVTMLAAGARAAAGDPRQIAGAHYSRGIELANQGLYAAALQEFNDANAISPHFAVLYNIGQAQIALDHPVEAIEALSRYLRDGADRIPAARRLQVQSQIGLLQSRLAELSITTEQAGVSIRIDGRDVGRTPLPQPIRLTAGTHTVTGGLADGTQITRKVALGEAERQRLELVFLPAPPAAAPASASAPSSDAHASIDLGARRDPTLRRAAYFVGGVGVLWAGAALGVYLWNRGRYDDWRAGDAALKTEMLGSTAFRERATANNTLASSLTTANTAILGLSIVGGALVAAGATMFLFDRARAHSRVSSEISFGWGPGSSPHMTWMHRW
jgi:tetratricopeptide (TPR) repeat protein